MDKGRLQVQSRCLLRDELGLTGESAVSQRVGHPRLPIFSLRTHSRPTMRIYGIISFFRAGQLAFAFPGCGRNAVFGFLLPVVLEGLSLVRQNRTCFFLLPFLFLSDAVDLPRLPLVYIVVETHRRLGGGSEGLGTIAATARVARQVPLPVVESRVSDFERPITEG